MFLLVTTINHCFWCFLIILMFVIKSNNSEKNPYQIVIFYIKKYNKRRILTSNRKRDWEFHLKKYLF